MKLNFRTRLTIWYVAALGLLLSITAGGLLYALGRIAEKKFDAALWMVGAVEAENAAASVHQRGLERPDELTVSNTHYREVLGYGRGPLEKYVTIIDDERRVADMTDNLVAPLPVDERLLTQAFAGQTVYKTARVSGVGPMRVVYMPVRGEAVPHPFVVMVGLPESFVDAELSSFRMMIVSAVLSLLLLTGASAMLLAERAIKPIERIISATEAIGADNLRARLPEPEADDQIGRLTRVLNEMLARIEKSFEAQRLFTARAAHELRTPLTILKGETQVALGRKRTVAEYEEVLRSSLEEVEKLVAIIEDLLLLARYEGGEADIPAERVRLHEVVAGAVDELRPVATRKRIEFAVEADELLIHGDPKGLKRLVCNLIENALHYTPGGGRVTARVVGAAARATFIVEDTGIGIAPEELPHIFQRFYRSHAAREMRPGGSGIGLAMAATIARLHGATIDVRSVPGSGTSFIVSFPCAADDEEAHDS